MPKFIPREKMGKKARKQSDKERRATWAFSPVTRKPDSSKAYNRRKAQDWKKKSGPVFLPCHVPGQTVTSRI